MKGLVLHSPLLAPLGTYVAGARARRARRIRGRAHALLYRLPSIIPEMEIGMHDQAVIRDAPVPGQEHEDFSRPDNRATSYAQRTRMTSHPISAS